MTRYYLIACILVVTACQPLRQVKDAVQTKAAVSNAVAVLSDKTAPFSTKAAAVACAAQSGFNWLADYMKAHKVDPKAIRTVSNFSTSSGKECR